MERRFKVGDRVRCINAKYVLPLGMAGVVVLHDGTDHEPYKVADEEGDFWWCDEDQLELIATTLTDAEVLRRAADIMRCEGEHAGADIAYGFADRLDPPRVDVLAVLREATEYVTENQPIYVRLAAAIKQMEADNA
jgi:hypothetical protein